MQQYVNLVESDLENIVMLKDRPCHVSIGVDTAEIWPHTKFAYAYRLPLRVIITALGTTIRRKVIASPRRTGREQARRSAPHSTPAQTLRGRVTPRNETRRWTLEPDSSHSIWRRIWKGEQRRNRTVGVANRVPHSPQEAEINAAAVMPVKEEEDLVVLGI